MWTHRIYIFSFNFGSFLEAFLTWEKIYVGGQIFGQLMNRLWYVKVIAFTSATENYKYSLHFLAAETAEREVFEETGIRAGKILKCLVQFP